MKPRDGKDPAGKRHEERKAMTVKELCALYLADRESGQVLGRGGKPKKASTMVTDGALRAVLTASANSGSIPKRIVRLGALKAMRKEGEHWQTVAITKPLALTAAVSARL